MNLPNKLTLFRVVLIPVFIVFMLVPMFECKACEQGSPASYIALGIFILASVTDFFDGIIARKKNLVTDFGKFMDPLADKLLCCSALICLVGVNDNLAVQLPVWGVILIIGREFIISGFRLIAADNGVVIAASYWGKFKTLFQMLLIGLLIVQFKGEVAEIITMVVLYVALALTVISLIDYIIKNRKVLKTFK
ncbi:MAG: CDP-diacylglycerol--glycerol-3-phosphate 3-phosphatidyltransferase [Lachnospiraceae bacterium]|nr:CDP-diacylglycerol--glycerol-3-phosphate 3-phosphatidyltransferase [Lachnospiraceae bacterium]